MEFSKFARDWWLDHREPTINGYTISSCNTGVESKLFDSLCETNITLYFVVNDLLKIKGDGLARLASFASQMLDAEIKEWTIHLDSMENDQFWSGENIQNFAACEIIANSMCGKLEAIYLSPQECDLYPWANLSKTVIDEFGGPIASVAAVALGGVALATILIRARNYQYAWCAAIGAGRLASYAEGRLMSDDDAKTRFAKEAVSFRLDQQLKLGWLEHCKNAKNNGFTINRLDDLLQLEGYVPEVTKISERTLKAWAKEAGIELKAGRPKK